jgi:divalent metal cation (Fe/Co/Zn/Cd) transporter
MTVQRSHQIAHEVKDQVRRRVPGVEDVLVHIEPARGEVGEARSPKPESPRKAEIRNPKKEA